MIKQRFQKIKDGIIKTISEIDQNLFSNEIEDLENSFVFEYNNKKYEVDTLCGSINSIIMMYKNPSIRKAILEYRCGQYTPKITKNIIKLTQEILKKDTITQNDFCTYIDNISTSITKYINNEEFLNNEKPDKNNDIIHKIIKNDKKPLLLNLYISKKANRFFPYDDFIFKFIKKTILIIKDLNNYNNTKLYNGSKKIIDIFGKNEFSISELKQNINNIVEKTEKQEINKYKTRVKIPVSVKVIFDHKNGGHLASFARNKEGKMIFYDAYSKTAKEDKNKDNEIVSVRYIKINTNNLINLDEINKNVKISKMKKTKSCSSYSSL